MPVLHARTAMWSRKQSVCSAVSGASKNDEAEAGFGGSLMIYPFAIALRTRVLQIVCGIAGLVIGAVGWLEERQKPVLGLGVPVGATTIVAATMSVYYSRGFGGWTSARSRMPVHWEAPWRALGPSPCTAVPLTLLWLAAIAGHTIMFVLCLKSFINVECSATCMGVAVAQLTVSATTITAAIFMVHLDLRFDASVSPPPGQPDTHTFTAVSMVPLTSVAANSGTSGDGGTESADSPQDKILLPEPT